MSFGDTYLQVFYFGSGLVRHFLQSQFARASCELNDGGCQMSDIDINQAIEE